MSLVFLHPKITKGLSPVSQQQGAALIMALMVVVLVTLLATTMANDFLVTFKRVENQLLSKQAYAFMRGSEGLARSALQLDTQSSNEKDHISEGWLETPQEFPMEQGILSGVICDLQGRFNVNNLLGKAAGANQYTTDQQVFVRLLQTLELEEALDQQQAEDITNAVIDWLDDGDEVSSTGGAEDSYYADLELPYRSANQPLQSVSELRWVKGVTQEIYLALIPHISALPNNALLNVNSAGLNVLRSINNAGELQPLSASDAESLLESRDGDLSGGIENIKEGFNSADEFVQQHPSEQLDINRLTVRSDFFLLDTTTYFMDRKFKMYSIIRRDEQGNVVTIARASSGLGQCKNTGV